MSSPYVTITHDDPDFKSYLLGSFSKELRALPLESFSQHSQRERVTFQLVPVHEIRKPAWWKIYFKACRPELLGLTLAPFLLTILWQWKQADTSIAFPISFSGALLGLFFLHVAAFLFNDFRDHMQGVDLANRRRGSQVIQKGWASAREVRGWAIVNMCLALLCGGTALYWHPTPLSWIVLAAAVAVLALSWMPSWLAKRGLSDLLVFAGLGPLLTIAAAITADGIVQPQVILLGTAFGSLAVLTLQVRQMENLFRAGQDSFRTFIGGLDFDRAKLIVLAQMLFVAAIQVAMAARIFHRAVAVVGFVFAFIPLAILFWQIRRAASPVSSDLIHLGRRAILAQTALLAWWGAAIWI
jgi:1,4-dihydroxy-2-naphthoate polyprenyltransferase